MFHSVLWVHHCNLLCVLGQNSLAYVHFCLKVRSQQDVSNEMNTFIQQWHIKLIKSDSKESYNVIKDFYFKLMLFFTFYLFYHFLSLFSQFLQNNKQGNGFQQW